MSSWTTLPLRSLATIRRGLSYSDQTLADDPEHGRPYFNMKSFRKGGGFNKEGLKYFSGSFSERDVATKHDVLIANTDVTPGGDIIGVPAELPMFLQESGTLFSHHVTRLSLGGLIDSRFLSYLLCVDHYRRWMLKYSRGTTVLMLDMHAIRKIPITFPTDKKEQLRIAEALTSLDTAIEKTEALIEKHQQIKAGLMHDLFTRGLLPNGQLRPSSEQAPELYRETPLGPLPTQWQPSSCGQSCSIDSGITLGPHRRPGKRAHPYLRVANVYRDEIRLHDVAMLEALPGEADFVLRTFDLLVVEGHANTAQIGRCAMVHDNAEGMLFQNHLFRLRATGINPRFALLWMNSHHVRRYWERVCATSSGLNTINRKMLNAVPVFVPPMNEQVRITEAMTASSDRIAGEVRQLDKLHTQKLGLMQDLLTGKVPVNVDAPAAEPADA